ncbi:DUF4129 domain-containing protein [Pseudomonas mangrovi]|uniref:DUF4129 domain-containing protein n=1 Tax=Pseudomonas mangrovi TaxID=2161748 RepID=A0A2T5PEL7_9PSED|nr:DUF4129 domain-containing protein [Pseudomonas mangrovi]PTU76168.1 DUF4129 domain-containing protein [Pseudomonas mangrovi]
MRLTDASVAIRPRTAWEALDLGTLMARRQCGVLMASWALITLPLLAVLTAVLWKYPLWALLIFWWLKPAYERLPLFILSRALFREMPTLRESLKAFPRLLRPQLFASLTWRRFSPSRSFDLPVLQLEGLSGSVRSQRLTVLGQRDSGAAAWLTFSGLVLEACLYFGLIALCYMLLPQQLMDDLGWQKLLQESGGEWLWLDHLRNWSYALVLMVWEPIYVACGFSLYLNRRTALEAWDIELAFRRLRQRLTGSAYALVLGLVLVFAMPAEHALAANSCPPPAGDFNPYTDREPDDKARLTNQALTSSQAKQAIKDLLAAAPFQNNQMVTRWRFGEEKPEEEPEEDDPDKVAEFFEKLFKLGEGFGAIEMISLIFKVVLWALLISLLALLIWRYREWLRAFASRLGLPQRAKREAPAMLFGLEITPESIPDDVAGTAERLWLENPREALGLLYRALLSRLLHEHRLPLKSAHTEGEVLRLVDRLQQSGLSQFSALLTGHWQNLAYGHRLPDATVRDQLCNGWRQQFSGQEPT